MRILMLIAFLAVSWAPPLCAQESSPPSQSEWYCYGKPLNRGADGGFTILKAVVFRPPADHPDPSGSAVVVFHGGGWAAGSEEWAFGAARRFAEMGMVGVAVNYRLSDQKAANPVDAMADAREAIRWVRLNARQLDVSPDRVVAYGWSAGAHLAAASAIFSDLPPHNDPDCVPNALVLKSPALDLVNDSWFRTLLGDSLVAADYSPLEHVRSGLPPTLIVQGRTDSVTPVGGAQEFHDKMVAAENRCELRVYEGVGHLFTPEGEPDDGYPNPDPNVQAAAWREIHDFLRSLGFLAGDANDRHKGGRNMGLFPTTLVSSSAAVVMLGLAVSISPTLQSAIQLCILDYAGDEYTIGAVEATLLYDHGDSVPGYNVVAIANADSLAGLNLSISFEGEECKIWSERLWIEVLWHGVSRRVTLGASVDIGLGRELLTLVCPLLEDDEAPSQIVRREIREFGDGIQRVPEDNSYEVWTSKSNVQAPGGRIFLAIAGADSISVKRVSEWVN